MLAVAALAGPAAASPGRTLRVGSRPGEYHSVQAAVDAVPAGPGPVTIVISPGTYTGQVYVPPDKPDLTLLGATGRAADVVITDDLAHGTVAPNGNQYGTDCSATLSVAGNGFAAYGITVQNTFDPTAHPEITSPQAVAVKTVADRVTYAHDRLLGLQDTVFASSYADPFTPEQCFAAGGPPATSPPGQASPPPARQLYYDDYITGDVDFLCGSGTAVFDRDTIDILGHPGGTVSAPDTIAAQKYGYLVTRSAIVNRPGNLAAASYFLARPWIHTGTVDPVPQITVRDSYLAAAISPQQWQNWFSPPFPWQDARFAEYGNVGPGAAGVTVPQLTAAQARSYTVASYLAGWRPPALSGWVPRA
ncbi:MAG: pectin esterase [Actinobacteria bacterium]|nr:pectin esterase [Actinomycetota bacterium]